MGGVGLSATIAGIVGYLAARSGTVYLLEPLASAVPRAKHVAFLTDLWAHGEPGFRILHQQVVCP